ncbi:glycerol-3-phosphate acyltransferase, partial [Anaerolinea sp.]
MALGFTLGSIPFAYILARVFTGRDVRAIGDGNPGAANAWKA